MSMPDISIGNIDFQQAKNNIIASVALEEAALSHVLNAEGEKLQAAVVVANVTIEQLLRANESIQNVVDAVSRLEQGLSVKIDAMLNEGGGGGVVPGTLSFKKVDIGGSPLGGAVFSLAGPGTPQSKSSADGSFSFDSLESGSYTLTETTVPTGYKFTVNSYNVEVTKSGQVTVSGNAQPSRGFNIINTKGDEMAFKVDDGKGNALHGSTVRLSGNKIGPPATGFSDEQDTNELGVIAYPDLGPGSYVLQITAVPAGYVLNPHTYQIEIAASGDITIDGQPMPGDAFTIVVQPVTP